MDKTWVCTPWHISSNCAIRRFPKMDGLNSVIICREGGHDVLWWFSTFDDAWQETSKNVVFLLLFSRIVSWHLFGCPLPTVPLFLHLLHPPWSVLGIRHFRAFFGSSSRTFGLQDPKPRPTNPPQILKYAPNKTPHLHEPFFEQFVRFFAFFPVTRVRNPTEIVQNNLFRWIFYFGCILGVDFPLLTNANHRRETVHSGQNQREVHLSALCYLLFAASESARAKQRRLERHDSCR